MWVCLERDMWDLFSLFNFLKSIGSLSVQVCQSSLWILKEVNVVLASILGKNLTEWQILVKI